MQLNKQLQQGEAFYAAGDKAAARACFQAVLETEPTHVEALNNMAVLAFEQTDYAQALAFLDKALAVNFHMPAARENQLRIYIRQSDWQQARPAADKLLQLAPAQPGIIDMAVQACLALKDSVWAIELIKLAAQQNRQDLLDSLQKLPASVPMPDWPVISSANHESIPLSAQYRELGIHLDPQLAVSQMGRPLGHLHDPASLDDNDLPLNPVPPVGCSLLRGPKEMADIKGASVMFAPTSIAGVGMRLAKWLKERGVHTTTVDYFPSYLAYPADYTYNGKSKADALPFLDHTLQLAEKHDIICFDYGCSFKYFPGLGMPNYNEDATVDQPYTDLLPLKDKGKKIFFIYWGSDCFNSSSTHYRYLNYLGFNDIPHPPWQNRFQYNNIKAMEKLADAIIAPAYFARVLPRTPPFWDICCDLDMWKPKTNYRNQVNKVLTAPTSMHKKNYGLVQACLNSLTARHPEITPFCVQNQPNHLVPELYADADIGIDQASGGFGLLAVEMMALGLPVISNYEFAREGCWREEAPLLQFSNIRELYARLEECVQNPQALQAIGKKGREYVEAYHTTDVQGRALSHYLAQALGRRPVWHMESTEFADNSAIWSQNPEEVLAFRYYDISVPLFCALGIYETALHECSEAIANEYRPEKFLAWAIAINSFTLLSIGYECKTINSKFLSRKEMEIINSGQIKTQGMINFYRNLLSSGRALLDEAAARQKEIRSMRIK